MRWKTDVEEISWYTRAVGCRSQLWCCLRYAVSFSPMMLCRHGNTQWAVSACLTHLHVVRGRFVAGSLKSLRHIAKDLHRRQQVACIKVPPLGEVKKVFGDLGHPIPREHPLALSKVPLNLQKQQRTELGAWLWQNRNDSYNFWANKVQNSRQIARLKSGSGHNAVILTDMLKSAILNKRVNWSRRHIFRRKVEWHLTSVHTDVRGCVCTGAALNALISACLVCFAAMGSYLN